MSDEQRAALVTEEALEWANLADDEGEYTTSAIIRTLVADRDTARQQLADAPHMGYCQFSYLSGAEDIRCTCWKAEV